MSYSKHVIIVDQKKRDNNTKNKEHIKEYRKEYNETHKEENKEYSATHREEQKEYRETHKEKTKAYREANADKIYDTQCAYKEKCKLPENRIICPKCGCSIVKYCFVKHTKEYKCIFFGVEDKPNREEWDKKQLENLTN